MQKIFGGIEESSAAATHPKGKRDLKELDLITRQGLDRLYNFQHSDGGWGWWKEGESDHFMTAYVLWGMTLAGQGGIEVKPDAAARAAAFLDKELVEQEANHDAQAWMLHALAVYHGQRSDRQAGPSAFQVKAFDNIWSNRDRLNAYTRALLALAGHHFGLCRQSQDTARQSGEWRKDRFKARYFGRAAWRAGFGSLGNRHCPLGRRWCFMALVGRWRRSDCVCAAGIPRNRSEEQTRRAGY